MKEVLLSLLTVLGAGGVGVALLDRRYRAAQTSKTASETKVIDVTAADAIVAASKGAVTLVTERMDAMARELVDVRDRVTDLTQRTNTAEERAERAEKEIKALKERDTKRLATVRRLSRRVDQLIQFLKDHGLEPPPEVPDYPEDS